MGHLKIRSSTGCSGNLQRMQLVDGLVFVRPLQVHLDLPDQREAVGVRNVQLLHPVYAVFLEETHEHQSQLGNASKKTQCMSKDNSYMSHRENIFNALSWKVDETQLTD